MEQLSCTTLYNKEYINSRDVHSDTKINFETCSVEYVIQKMQNTLVPDSNHATFGIGKEIAQPRVPRHKNYV